MEERLKIKMVYLKQAKFKINLVSRACNTPYIRSRL